MMRRKVTEEQLREIMLNRLIKGDAFCMPTLRQYQAEQLRVEAKLAKMSGADIFAQYPSRTLDLKLRTR